MPSEKGRRRPAGTASRSNGRADQDHERDTRILAARDADFDCAPRQITWTDRDADRVIEFIARLETGVRP